MLIIKLYANYKIGLGCKKWKIFKKHSSHDASKTKLQLQALLIFQQFENKFQKN